MSSQPLLHQLVEGERHKLQAEIDRIQGYIDKNNQENETWEGQLARHHVRLQELKRADEELNEL